MSRDDDVIRASEVGQYAFCARSWWLARVKGRRSTNLAALERGTARHRAHGRAVQSYHLLRWAALALFLLAAVFLLTWLIVALRG